jgi:peptide deformylase
VVTEQVIMNVLLVERDIREEEMIDIKNFPIYEESFLRQKSIPVKSKKEALELKEQLEAKFPEKGGYAVACVQIGILKRASLVKLPSTDALELVCNPEIIYQEEEFLMQGEGCLSFPNQPKNTIRYNRVKVKYRDIDWEERTVILEGIEAVIFQHEIDHFDGILWKDRVIQPIRVEKKIGRNEVCPICASKGRIIKWKKCKDHNMEA